MFDWFKPLFVKKAQDMNDFQEYFDAIEGHFVDGLEKEIIEAAFDNLVHASKLRPNNFAFALREALDRSLMRLAPEDQVRQCHWFAPRNPEFPDRVNLEQRMHYALCKGLSVNHIGLVELDVQERLTDLNKSRNKLSQFTHIKTKLFNLREADQDTEISSILDSLVDYFEAFDSLQEEIELAVEGSLSSEVFGEYINETDEAIAEISNRYEVNGILCEEHRMVSINADCITFEVSGEVDVTQHLGGKRDGISMDGSYPFKCVVNFPCNIDTWTHASVHDLITDNSSWYE